jgi:hypothetical protein
MTSHFTPLYSTALHSLSANNISSRPHRKHRSNSSYTVTSHRCRTDRVENTASQLVHWCVSGICCLATAVVYSHYLAMGLHITIFYNFMENSSREVKSLSYNQETSFIFRYRKNSLFWAERNSILQVTLLATSYR